MSKLINRIHIPTFDLQDINYKSIEEVIDKLQKSKLDLLTDYPEATDIIVGFSGDRDGFDGYTLYFKSPITQKEIDSKDKESLYQKEYRYKKFLELRKEFGNE